MRPTILVCGLGRCGSSLTMQMLHAAGVPCVGTFPAFEGPECEAFQDGFINASRWPTVAGRAVKLLDPHRRAIAWPTNLDIRAIWLTRDPIEQARSQAKVGLLAAALECNDSSRQTRRRLSNQYLKLLGKKQGRWVRAINAEALAAGAGLVSGLGEGRVLDIAYEQLLATPRDTALRIAQFSGFGFDQATLDSMAACVRKSDPACAPDIAMEIDLLEAVS